MRRAVGHINAYLMAMEDVYVMPSPKPLGALPAMVSGDFPGDYGHLTLDEQERCDLIAAHQILEPYILPFLNIKLTWHGIGSFILYLAHAPQHVLDIPAVRRRLESVSKDRALSATRQYRDRAKSPHLFIADRHKPVRESCGSLMNLAFPRITSYRRRYVPIEMHKGEVIAPCTYRAIYGCPVWVFAVLSSSLFTSWLRATSGRTKNDFMLSVVLTYNTFPWNTAGNGGEKILERSALGILNEREISSRNLSVLYGRTTMPERLIRAHRDNDRAVESVMLGHTCETDEERLRCLLEKYHELTSAERKGLFA